MREKYKILTNNIKVKELIEKLTDYELVYLEGASVTQVISKCEMLFLEEGLTLAADPMGGRRARPFPYLTLILAEAPEAKAYDWDRIGDYAVLDSSRKHMYEHISKELDEDFQHLDWSLTKAALNINT